MQDFSPRQIGDLIEVLSFYILRVEEAFCLGAGNAVHIDVAAAQKRQVAVSHIQLKARQVGVVFCVEACVCVAENILNPASAKARIVPNFAPSALPVCRAYRRTVFGFMGNQKSVQDERNFHLADTACL